MSDMIPTCPDLGVKSKVKWESSDFSSLKNIVVNISIV